MASLTPDHISATARDLYSTIREQARRAGYRLPARYRQEFIDEAPGAVFLKLRHFDPDRGSLPAWIGTVLTNQATDLLRRHIRERSLLVPMLEIDPGFEPDARKSPVEMLSAADIALIETWPDPKERIRFLCISSLWECVSVEQRRRWLQAAEVEDASALDALGGIDEVTERIERTAAVLGESFDAAQRTWYRKRRGPLCDLLRVKNLVRDANQSQLSERSRA